MRTFLGETARGRHVPGAGPLGSKVLFLGEAPGKEEEEARAPFVGAAGRFLWEGRDWHGPAWEGLAGLGLARADVRVENVGEVRPPDNSLLAVSPEAVRRWQEGCWRRLEAWSGHLIVPLGNLALNTLTRAPLPVNPKTGKWRTKMTMGVPSIAWRDKIGAWRGSVSWARFAGERKVKMIPTWHPSYVMRGGQGFDTWMGDWRRILGDQGFPELRRLRAEHEIDPTPAIVRAFEADVAHIADDPDAMLTFDIETTGGKGWNEIRCIGFCLDPSWTLTLGTRTPWERNAIRRLLASRIRKNSHYGLFDRFKLARSCGIAVARAWWDSHMLHHCLDPRDEHKLAYCASRDLRVEYWKDEAKEEGENAGFTEDDRKLRRYCGKDVSRTNALTLPYIERVREAGLLDFYRTHYRQLADACLRMSLAGFRVDEAVRRRLRDGARAQLEVMRGQLASLTPLPLLGKAGGFSSPQVARFFYDAPPDGLGYKPFFRRGTGKRTADELALRRLAQRYKKARPGVELVLGYRSTKKQAESLARKIADEDGRVRSLYTPTAKTGRLRSRKPLKKGSGRNMQNLDSDDATGLRRMFVAEPGHMLVQLDESQAEDRMVDGKSGDPTLLREVASIEVDRHIRHAVWISGGSYKKLLEAYLAKDPAAIKERQRGKKTRHALNYGMGGARMAEVELVESEGAVVLDPDECQEWLDALKRRIPGIDAYHAWVRGQLLRGYLEDSWGWRCWWKCLRLSQEDHKEGYAWHGSGEVARLMNQLGFRFADREIQRGRWPGAVLVQQGHDSLVASLPPAHAFDFATAVWDSLTQERMYPGAGGPWKLAMPVGIKVGRNFSFEGGVEWKTRPSQGDFRRALHSLAG